MVECFLAKEDVAGSTPVSRSNNLNPNELRRGSFRTAHTVRCVFAAGSVVLGLFLCLGRGTQVVRERSAKPLCVGSIPTRASNISTTYREYGLCLCSIVGANVRSISTPWPGWPSVATLSKPKFASGT